MILDRLFKHRIIHNCDHEPYLHRWYVIRTNPLAVFIHKFVRSDEDRALHDHPWNFLVIPIWRGYFEHSDKLCRLCRGDGWITIVERVTCPMCFGRRRIERRKRVLPILGARFRTGTYRHRVELIHNSDGAPLPSWSIFIRFGRWREWGFWTQAGWVHWKNWWQENCE